MNLMIDQEAKDHNQHEQRGSLWMDDQVSPWRQIKRTIQNIPFCEYIFFLIISIFWILFFKYQCRMQDIRSR